ncbi:MAG: tetratricopeptide repeat protein [Candidatus Andersenbacteria bacterium]
MSIVLRYLPPVLTFLALAVLAWVVVRRLPKTAKLEAELAVKPKPAAVAKPAAVGGAANVASNVSSTVGKAGRLLARASRGLAVGVGQAAKRIRVGRLGKVLTIAQRRRPAPVSVVATAGTTSEAALDETQRTVLQLLREAEDYTRQSNWPAAEKVYIKVVALAPKTLEAYLGLGNLYLAQHNWNDAAESYKLVLEGDPDNSTAWGNYGQALANKGEWVAAVDALAKAAKLDPGNATRQAMLGLAYVTIKDYKKAVKAFREAVDHDRENLSHKVELAKVAELTGDKALAEEMLTAVLTRDPLNEQAKAKLNELRATKDLE